MTVTVVSCPSGQRTTAAEVRTVASLFASGLTERVPDVVLDLHRIDAAALQQTDLLVVATSVPLAPALSPLLDALAADRLLAGCLVFLAAVGPWPAEAGTVERTVLPAVRRAGGSCMAPTLHVVDAAPAPIATFCRYWRPVATALLQGRLVRTAAA